MDDAVQPDAVVCIAVAGAEARRLRALRVAAGLTQGQLAARSGVSQESISRLERGIQRPQASTLQRVAHALGVSTDQLLGVDPPADVTICVDVRRLPRTSAAFRERVVSLFMRGSHAVTPSSTLGSVSAPSRAGWRDIAPATPLPTNPPWGDRRGCLLRS